MTQEEWEDLVRRELRDEATANERSTLMGDLEGWLDELMAIRQSVDVQITERRAALGEYPESDELVIFEEWRARALRFKTYVDRRVREVRRLRSQATHNRESSRLWQLIARHRQVSIDEGWEPSPHDIELWREAGGLLAADEEGVA